MSERGLPGMDGAPACPFVAFGDDRDGRSASPDHRHRCFAESPPAPRAVAHQEAYCLSSAFPVCPTFQDWARREAAHARGAGDRAETPPTATTGTTDPSAVAGAGAAAALAAERAADLAASEGPDPHGDGRPATVGPDGHSDEGTDIPGDLPVRRNPPRDWAAPPPWATGAGATGAARRSNDADGSDLLATRAVEGRGLVGSAADRLAGGPAVPVPATPTAPTAPGTGSPHDLPGASSAGTTSAAAASAAAASGAAAAWSASAAGSHSAAPDDELAGLVRGRGAQQTLDPGFAVRPDPGSEGRPGLIPTRPEEDRRALPARTGRRPSVSSTRPPGPEIPGPTWERMRRYEAYPTLRSRAGLASLPGLSRVAILAGALAIAALALFMLPALLGVGGGKSASPAPSGSGSRPLASASEVPATPGVPTPQVYIVKSGDTMSKIAARFGLKPEDLCAANSATVKNCDKIALGQQIIIPVPGSGAVASPSGSPAP